MLKSLCLFFLLTVVILNAQPIYPPATQAEVDAGLVKGKFVSPFTLSGWSGAGGGATGSYTFISPLSVANLTNVSLPLALANLNTNLAITNIVTLTNDVAWLVRVAASNNVRYLTQSDDIRTAFLAVSNNSTVFARAGTWSVTPSNFSLGTLGAAYMSFTNKTNLVFKGEGMNSKMLASGSGQVLQFQDCDGVVFDGWTFESDKGGAAGYTSNGVPVVTAFIDLVRTNRNFTFMNCTFKNLAVHGIASLMQPSDFNSDIRIINNTGQGLGSTNAGGISDGSLSALSGNNILIHGNRVIGAIRSFEIYNGTGGNSFSNIIVSGNNIQGFGLSAIHLVGSGPLRNVLVVNNTIQSGEDTLRTAVGSYGIHVNGYVSDSKIIGNSVSGAELHGIIAFEGVTNLSIEGNQVLNSGELGIAVNDASGGLVTDDVRIFGNVIKVSGQDGIQIGGGRNITVDNNTVINPGNSREGIYVYGGFDLATNVIVRNNFIKTTSGTPNSGIRVSNGSKAVILDNNTIIGFTTPYFIEVSDRGETTVTLPLKILEATLTAGVYTATDTDTDILVPNGTSRSVTLPPTPMRGRTVVVRDGGFTASGTNIIIGQGDADLINGQTSTNIVINGGSLVLRADGTNWQVIAAAVGGGSGVTDVSDKVSTNFNTALGTNFISGVASIGTPDSGDLIPILDISTAQRKYVSIGNLPAGTASPGGASTQVQFNQGGVLDGKSTFVYYTNDHQLKLQGIAAFGSNSTRAKLVFTNDSSGSYLEINPGGISLSGSQTFEINSGSAYAGYGTNIMLLSPSSLRPGVDDSMDFGISALRIKNLSISRAATMGSINATGSIFGNSLIVTNAVTLPALATNSLVYVGGGGILQTTILGANLSWSSPGTLAASGGAASTNNPVDAMGFVVPTNGVIQLQRPLLQSGTNLWAVGDITGGTGSASWSNNISFFVTSGVTNVMYSNMVVGAIMDVWLTIAPGVTVQFPQFTASQWLGGRVPSFATNGNTIRVQAVNRGGGITNLWVAQQDFTLVRGGPIVLVTNFATGDVTLTLDPVLTNHVGTVGNNVTNVVSGWGVHNLTAAGTLTTTLTNRSVGIATNAFNILADFSDTANTQIYNVTQFSTNAVTIAATNGVAGRTVCIYMGTNMLSYTVRVLAMDSSPILWNWNVTTNGATAFTKTNTVAARVFLTRETNGVYTAEMGYYRN
jgi:hypothetical protein